jgi:hypothetical protein
MNRSDYRLYAIATCIWLAAFLGLGGSFVG